MTLARVPAPGEARVAPAAPPRDLSSWRGPLLAGLAAVVVTGAAVGGYAVGHSNRSTAKNSAAAPSAPAKSAPSGGKGTTARDFARGRRAGGLAGRTAGTTAGGRAGRQAGAAVVSGATPANASVTGRVRNCPKTPIVGKAVVSSAGNMSCGTAASDQRQAFDTGHIDKTPGGFTCHRLTVRHYRCVNGNKAYRWDDGV